MKRNEPVGVEVAVVIVGVVVVSLSYSRHEAKKKLKHPFALKNLRVRFSFAARRRPLSRTSAL